MRSGRCGQADGFGVTVMKNRPMTRVNLDKAIARMAGDDSCARAVGEKGKDYGDATER